MNGIPVKTGQLSGGDKQFVWVYSKTFDIIGVSQIVPLNLVFNIIKNNNSSDKVNDFTGG
jgi:hypothetical protein